MEVLILSKRYLGEKNVFVGGMVLESKEYGPNRVHRLRHLPCSGLVLPNGGNRMVRLMKKGVTFYYPDGIEK
jgi:hypothetical protein